MYKITSKTPFDLELPEIDMEALDALNKHCESLASYVESILCEECFVAAPVNAAADPPAAYTTLFDPKTHKVTIRLPVGLIDAFQAEGKRIGQKYQTLIKRILMEEAISWFLKKSLLTASY